MAAPSNRVIIVGIGAEGTGGLSPSTREFINKAQTLLGGRRLLEMFPDFAGEKLPLDRHLPSAIDYIKNNLGKRNMVVLASGDPNFFGIARLLVDKLGNDAVEVIPAVSLMQTAFARIKESWDDAALTSVHGRPVEEIIGIVRANRKIGLFTDNENTPAKIASILRENGIANCAAYVCEDLGTEMEKVTVTKLYSLIEIQFSPLNYLILIQDDFKKHEASIGIPDEEFQRRAEDSGLITKLEVRAVSLAKMRLTENSVVWDIGAGSGAVSIEASILASQGLVFAVEKNEKDIEVIHQNTARFKRFNIKIVHALAPDKLEELPRPSAVFIGGSAGNMAQIIEVTCRRLKTGGRIVINAVTFENLALAAESLKKNGFESETCQVSIARSKAILDLTRLEALNPVFVITGWKA